MNLLPKHPSLTHNNNRASSRSVSLNAETAEWTAPAEWKEKDFESQIKKLEGKWLATAKEQGLTTQEEVVSIIAFKTGETEEMVKFVDVPSIPLTDLATSGEYVQYWAFIIGYDVLPNFQVMWLADAITQGLSIPPSYVWESVLYAIAYSIAAIAAGVILFQRREVG